MDRIETAFQAIDRVKFLPPEFEGEAAFDVPVPIGHGQTNSQPTTVQLMLDWLDPQPGDKVLDVGSGSGWTSALLGHVVRPKGRVYAVEKVPELVSFGRDNTERAGLTNVQFFEAENVLGLPDFAPYDRILVSAAAAELPQDLVKQLKVHGKIVIPVGETILEITKLPGGTLDINPHYGFLFVPLV